MLSISASGKQKQTMEQTEIFPRGNTAVVNSREFFSKKEKLGLIIINLDLVENWYLPQDFLVGKSADLDYLII